MKGTWDYYNDYYSPGPSAAPDTYSAEYFRENLEALLEMKNLKQAQAAEMCDLTPPMLWNWLTGKSEPNLYSFTRLCAGLGIEPNWMLSKHERIK